MITIPAGVIQPKDLLMWLRDRRDNARAIAQEYADQGDDYETCEWNGYALAYDEVIQHISFGGAS